MRQKKADAYLDAIQGGVAHQGLNALSRATGLNRYVGDNIGGTVNSAGSLLGLFQGEAPTLEELDEMENDNYGWIPGNAMRRTMLRRRMVNKLLGGKPSTIYSEKWGPSTAGAVSMLGGGALGALAAGGIAAALGKGAVAMPISVLGGMGGMSLGAIGSLIADNIGALRAAMTPNRTDEEQEEYEKGNNWKNWIIPGYARYNWYKSLGVSNRKLKEYQDKKKKKEDKKSDMEKESSYDIMNTIIKLAGETSIKDSYGLSPYEVKGLVDNLGGNNGLNNHVKIKGINVGKRMNRRERRREQAQMASMPKPNNLQKNSVMTKKAPKMASLADNSENIKQAAWVKLATIRLAINYILRNRGLSKQAAMQAPKFNKNYTKNNTINSRIAADNQRKYDEAQSSPDAWDARKRAVESTVRTPKMEQIWRSKGFTDQQINQQVADQVNKQMLKYYGARPSASAAPASTVATTPFEFTISPPPSILPKTTTTGYLSGAKSTPPVTGTATPVSAPTYTSSGAVASGTVNPSSSTSTPVSNSTVSQAPSSPLISTTTTSAANPNSGTKQTPVSQKRWRTAAEVPYDVKNQMIARHAVGDNWDNTMKQYVYTGTPAEQLTALRKQREGWKDTYNNLGEFNLEQQKQFQDIYNSNIAQFNKQESGLLQNALNDARKLGPKGQGGIYDKSTGAYISTDPNALNRERARIDGMWGKMTDAQKRIFGTAYYKHIDALNKQMNNIREREAAGTFDNAAMRADMKNNPEARKSYYSSLGTPTLTDIISSPVSFFNKNVLNPLMNAGTPTKNQNSGLTSSISDDSDDDVTDLDEQTPNVGTLRNPALDIHRGAISHPGLG